MLTQEWSVLAYSQRAGAARELMFTWDGHQDGQVMPPLQSVCSMACGGIKNEQYIILVTLEFRNIV